MKRLASLDALRGFDMIWLIGLTLAIRGLFALFPGGTGCWFERQFHHVAWDGLAFFDTIFPLFVFIAGVSFPFSHAKQVERGASAPQVHLRIFRRMALLLLLGAVYNGLLQFKLADFRFASVLGKIGMAWAVAALLYVHLGVKARVGVFVATLCGYWAMLHLVAPDAPAGADSFSLAGCFPGYMDRLGFTPGDLYCKLTVNGVKTPWLEPSGVVVSVLGSSASAMLGMLAGDLLRSERFAPNRKAALLAFGGAVALAAGLLVSLDCPLVKNLWTPSFTLVCGGEAFLLFALFYYVIDVKGRAKWCFPLQVIGLNAIVAYMMQAFVGFMPISKFFFGGLAGLCPTPDFVLALGYTLCCWLVLWFLYRKNTFLKL